jgi:tetratricopeptide (TPR) repeat protein
MNMWCLLILTKPLERLMGKLTTFMVYILTAIGSSLLSLGWDPGRVGAGASGAVFGIAGVLISFFYFAKLDLPRERIKSILGWVTRFAIINLAFGFSLKLAGIDIIGNAAHLGGLITGLLLGFFFARTYDVPAEERFGRQLLILAAMSVVLVALFPPIIKAKLKSPKMESFYGEDALRRADYSSAIIHLQKAVAINPDNAGLHGLLGYALAGTRRYDDALREYNQALALQPAFPWVEVNKAAVYLATGQPAVAASLFKKNVGKIPWESEDFRFYGDALMQTGDLSGAEAALLQAVNLDPKDTRPHRLLGRLYAKMGRTADAEREEKLAGVR